MIWIEEDFESSHAMVEGAMDEVAHRILSLIVCTLNAVANGRYKIN
jgi:hypothetical protein